MTNYKTVKYYDENANTFVSGTENADLSEIRNKFLRWIPEGGYILDWGCGSGRDAIVFLCEGYQVDARDGSVELSKLASQKTGIVVKHENFMKLDETEKYDGIWACASLLHVEKKNLTEVFGLAQKALKPSGVIYVSFKYGDFEGERNGRFFTDMTENGIEEIVREMRSLNIKEQWITADVRAGREDEKWLNLILQKSDIN